MNIWMVIGGIVGGLVGGLGGALKGKKFGDNKDQILAILNEAKENASKETDD